MIDSHAHVAYFENEAEREGVIARAREAGVAWIEIGTDVERSQKAVELASRLRPSSAEASAGKQDFGLIGVTVGVHPSDVAAGIDWKEIEKLLSNPGVVAVGEVGIDLHHSQNLEEQLEALEKFVNLAREKSLPIVFHVRDGKTPHPDPLSPHAERGPAWKAHNEMIKFLREQDWHRGVVHTFSGNKEQAKQYLELGLHLSFSGVVTYKNAGEIAEMAKIMPLEKMLIETDCPYLTPEPLRGEQNEPAYVKYVAEKIANLRGISFEEVAQATEENTRNLFRLSSLDMVRI